MIYRRATCRAGAGAGAADVSSWQDVRVVVRGRASTELAHTYTDTHLLAYSILTHAQTYSRTQTYGHTDVTYRVYMYACAHAAPQEWVLFGTGGVSLE